MHYVCAAMVSFALFAMGIIALILAIIMFIDNRKSKSCIWMLMAGIAVFFWNVGYGLMGLCYESDFAYVPRAIALFAVVLYIVFVIEYVTFLSGFSKKKSAIVSFIGCALYLISWLSIIRKDAVTFEMTPWGYWYRTSLSNMRILQSIACILVVVYFYRILNYWKKSANYLREKYVIKRFSWFGILIIGGYFLDTVFPMLFKSAAVPGSCIGAFASAILLLTISSKYKSQGITVANVAEYVFAEVTIPVLVLGPDGKIVLSNSKAGEFFTKSLAQKSLDDIVEKIDDKETIKNGKINEIHKVKGKEIFCRLENTTVDDEFGEPICSIVFASDMTEYLKAAEQSEEMRRVAEEASVAKSSFLANMSHEIRTPMNAIIGMSDILLRDQKLDEETQSQLYNIKDAGSGLLEIINDILDISKIESGKYELIESVYDIPSLIHDVSTIIGVKLQETPVLFNISVDPGIPNLVYGDVVRVRRILINILGNAIKFTKKGRIDFIATSEIENGEAVLHFDVKDTGIGIKPEDIGTIFGAFNQVDTRKNRSIQGTGLGLAISKNLAMLMGGDITVESTYGEGSVFHIVIRQEIRSEKLIGEKVARSLEERKYFQSKEADEITIIPRPDKRVLVVDDTRINLTVARGFLKPYDFQIDTATNGRDAIELVKENDYDLVFMDHMMPELDGVDTTHIIRDMKGDKYKNLIIIALTANAVSGTKEKLVAEGMQDFLAKPINKKELNDIINKWL